MPSSSSDSIGRAEVTGVVLAGGRGRRMDGVDKGLITLEGRSLAAHVLESLRPQVADVLISANRNLERYRELGARVVTDHRVGYLGPLSGIASALAATSTPYALIVPCDTPCLPSDLRSRLAEALSRQGAQACAAHDGVRVHPTIALIDTALRNSADHAVAEARLELGAWLRQHRFVTADLSDRAEALTNVNTPEEVERLASRLGREAGGC